MKLNRVWTGPWEVTKRLGEVFTGSSTVGLLQATPGSNGES